MSAALLLAIAIVVFLAGYIFYGRFLVKKFNLNPSQSTPAHEQKDGVDYVPAKSPVLLGHHFASIAGAGPILGPIYAAVFGWIPVALWIMIGSIFFGGVHDFASLVASVRHGGKSIGEVIEEQIGVSGKRLFLIFTWFMLVLVVAVFVNAVASTFVKAPASASASFLFILVAVGFGLSVYRMKSSLTVMSIIGVLLLLGCILIGLKFPVSLSFQVWVYILFLYAAIAAVTPVWILLQPRDYLNAFLLYFMLISGIIGIFVTNPKIVIAPVTGFKADIGLLFPILFVTVACGAISGFHSLVASGTTAKQLNKETDAKVVGYGAMLIEGLLAIVALITATTILQSDYIQGITAAGGGPIGIFSSGLGRFISTLGIPLDAAVTFAALAISAFALTSLDTATRLGRFIFQEFFYQHDCEKQSVLATNRYIGTLITVLAAWILTISGSGRALWPLFGSANQLLAAMALLTITVWFANMKKKNRFVLYPMIFMFLVTLTALVNLVIKNVQNQNWVLTGMGVLLFVVAIFLIVQAYQSVKKRIGK